MMFGMREQFAYFRCATCGCLQLNEIPRDMARFYTENYYSFQKAKTISLSLKDAFKRRFFNRSMTRHVLGWRNFFGHFFCRLVDHPDVPAWLRFLARPVRFDSAILDVGCGSGMSLVELYECGFEKLLGVDPYIAKPLQYEGGVRVDKCELQEVQGKFDLIMFHHVLEHLENPLKALLSARELLAHDGQILIRIPLSDSMAAEKYREKWVQLDAPRHITLQTRKSMELLAHKAGLKITRITYDSFDFQFWGSEQYLAGIPLTDPRSQVSGTSHLFSPEQLAGFAKESALLNLQEKGDQAAFILEDAQA
jgi:2-polyprenyl-3-methyl-5-hydroxy-6-metoxy-1,4-benzoquinol methylase